MSETRVFKLLNGVTMEKIGEALERYLSDYKGMETQLTIREWRHSPEKQQRDI